MAILIPPPPTAEDKTFTQDWYIRVRNAINKLGSSITWAILDKTGSKLSDIETRNHSDLQNIQGGSYHLTSEQIADFEDKADKLLEINNQTGTTYTLVLSDAHKYIRLNNASAISCTIPPNSSVALAVGTTVHIRQVGAGQVTIVAGSGVTILTPETLLLRTQGSIVSITKVDTNTWEIYGDLE